MGNITFTHGQHKDKIQPEIIQEAAISNITNRNYVYGIHDEQVYRQQTVLIPEYKTAPTCFGYYL